MIKLENISISYIKEYATLINVNAELSNNTLIIGSIEDGTVPLFRIISKIENDYTGKCIIDDRNIRKIKDKDLDLAYLPSCPYLFKNRNIFDNLYYPLKIRKIKKKDIAFKIQSLIDKYLIDFPNDIKKMNISQQKIIVLIRAMIREPKYVLIENLFDNLNSAYKNIAYELISKISKQSIVIACEPIEVECYADFKKYLLTYGSLI